LGDHDLQFLLRNHPRIKERIDSVAVDRWEENRQAESARAE
jgi:hypothetical protein